MIAAGYLAKRVNKPVGFNLETVSDVYSVSACVSDNFANYIEFWRHNGFWLFDSPEIIRAVAAKNSIELSGTQLFYYEVYEKEYDGKTWSDFHPESSMPTQVVRPELKTAEGFDVVTFFAKSSPECSPLSCNGLARKIPTNTHCLLNSFEEAFRALESGAFIHSEPGPYRIFAVYSVAWPKDEL